MARGGGHFILIAKSVKTSDFNKQQAMLQASRGQVQSMIFSSNECREESYESIIKDFSFRTHKQTQTPPKSFFQLQIQISRYHRKLIE